MKFKISVIIVAAIVLLFWQYSFNDMGSKSSDAKQKEVVISEKQPVNKIVSKVKSIERSISKLTVSQDARLLAEQLLPISPDELARVWEEEYGCYVYGSENVSIDDALLSNECVYSLLTADSYDEAMWMQRQGYPSKGNLNKLKNAGFRESLEELAGQNYKPAIALLAIHDLESGNTESAVSRALTLTAYSDRNLTFPHRLHGEALIANDMGDLGAIDLQVAALLGDTEAGYIATRYIGSNVVLTRSVINNAHLRMSRYFNLSYEEYPVDQRPDPLGG